MTSSDQKTVELPFLADSLRHEERRRKEVSVSFGATSHPGKVRPNNEDHYAVVRRTRSREILLTNVDLQDSHPPDDHAYVLIVADGIGGRGFGELASELVLRVGWEVASDTPSWIMKFDESQWPAVRERVAEFTHKLQSALQERAQHQPRLAGMGTTWTCVYTMQADAIVAHVGDSRAYLLRAGMLRQLSEDQTLAQELQNVGLPKEETSPFKHILTSSLGAHGDPVRTQVDHFPLCDGDRLLLCTDGLTDMLPDEEITNILAAGDDPQTACNRLLSQALDRGGKDNVTIIVADYHFEAAVTPVLVAHPIES